MISNDERREVARRLREVQAYVIPGTKTEEHPITGRIIGVACGYDLPDFQGLLGRLADLIEPSIPSGPGDAGLASVDGFIREMRHSTKEEQNEYSVMLEKMSVEMHPVDRDALLALADELEQETGSVCGVCMGSTARRIREALGVER